MYEKYRGWVIFIIGISAILGLQFYLNQRPHPLEGHPAPTFKANSLKGESISLASHIGTDIILLDFWAIWCPPCRVSLPEVAAIAEDYAGKGVTVYAVNEGDAPEHISTFLEELDIEPPVLLDPAGAAAQKYQVSGIPQLVIIDRSGNVDTVHVGAGPGLRKALRNRLDALLEDRVDNQDN